MKKLMALFLLCIGLLAHADDSLYVIVTLPAGSGQDVLARQYVKRYDELHGTASVVLNKTGGEGVVGIKYFLSLNESITGGRIPLLWPAGGHFHYYRDSDRKDFTPLIETAKSPGIFVVTKNSPINSWQEWIDYNKANPGKVNQGTSTRVWIGFFNNINVAHGISPNPIFYPGSQRTEMDIASGNLEAGWMLPGTYFGTGFENRVKAIATSSAVPLDAPIPLIKDIDKKVEPWYLWSGFFIQSSMPADVKKQLFERLDAIRSSPWAKENIARNGTQIPTGSSEDFIRHLNKFQQDLERAEKAENKTKK